MLDHTGGGGGPQKPSPLQPLLTLFHPCRSKISSLAEVFSVSPLDTPSLPAVSPVLRQPAAITLPLGLKSAPRFWLWHRLGLQGEDGTPNASNSTSLPSRDLGEIAAPRFCVRHV